MSHRQIFLNEKNLKGILVGGSGPTKQYFTEEDYLHYEIKDKIIEVFDTGYTDEYGLKELVSAASDTMSNLKISREKKLMKRFLKEVTKSEQSLAVYGEIQVRKALEMGVVDTLLLSENLRKYRIKLKCPSCGISEERTISEDNFEDFDIPSCSSCGTNESMEMEKIDLIDELSDLADKTGCSVELISQDSEEGDSLFSAFSGIAGILRYPVDL